MAVLLLAIPSLTAAAALAAAPAPESTPGAPAFEQAFRFASAITVDPKDMALAQEGTVLDLGTAGALDRALTLTGRIDGWRRGVAYAELASMLAAAGRPDEARAAIASAEAVRTETTGWPNPRISQHVATAWASLGDVERAGGISSSAAPEDRQYLGRPTATLAAALGRSGRFDEAMATLAALDGQADPDVAWWRTWGYTELARLPSIDGNKRQAALAAARRSSESIPGWREAAALEQVADAANDRGERGMARSALE